MPVLTLTSMALDAETSSAPATLRQLGAKIGSRVRFVDDPEGVFRVVKTDEQLDRLWHLPWQVFQVFNDFTGVTLHAALSEADRIGLTVRDLEIIARLNDDFIAAIMRAVAAHDAHGLVEVV